MTADGGGPSGGDPGPLIGRGRAADVFDIGSGRVLRRNRGGESTELEATVMAHLAAHGFPVPRVYDTAGPDLIMERIQGATMLDAFPRRPWMLRRWATVLASLHQRLLTVPLPDIELRVRFGKPEAIVHGDLHPDNVMLAPGGPVVIDWPNASLGPRGSDVASTWIISATSEVDGGRFVRALASVGQATFVEMFLRRSDRHGARELLPLVAAERLRDRNVRPVEAENVRRLLREEGIDPGQLQ